MKQSMSYINIRQISVGIALLFSLCMPLRAYAAAGDLDPTFGNGGKVTTDFGGSDVANALAIQPDGKIVVAGNTSALSLVLARYNVNGSLDTSFGTGGSVVTGLLSGFDVAIQPDGKIVVAGNSGADFAVARFNSNGSLDTSFGSGGVAITDFSGEADLAFAVALRSDGKIVAVGRAFNFNNGTFADFALARYNSDGSLDASFGNGGKVTTDFFSDSDSIEAIVIQSNGKIVAAGSASFGLATQVDFALARYNSDGSLDASFGNGGKVTTDFFNRFDVARDVALQPDGKIVAAGIANTSATNTDFGLARYLGDEVVAFDLCLQDDNDRSLLRFSSTTGEYQFINCGGLSITGTGNVQTHGCTVVLRDSRPDRRVMAQFNTCNMRGTASIQVLSPQRARFGIIDRDTTNSTCSCQ